MLDSNFFDLLISKSNLHGCGSFDVVFHFDHLGIHFCTLAVSVLLQGILVTYCGNSIK